MNATDKILHDNIQNFFDENINQETELLSKNINTKPIHYASSSSTLLLPIEQLISPPIYAHLNNEITNLHCNKHQSNVNSFTTLQEKHQMNLETNWNEEIENVTKAQNSPRDFIPQELSSHLISLPNLQGTKRSHTSNPFYITENLNQSLFNEGPTNKRARTPFSNSPSPPFSQSHVETRAQSPLPIPHEIQTSLSHFSYSNESEDIIDSNDVSSNFEILQDFFHYDEDINGLMDILMDDHHIDETSIQYTTLPDSTFPPSINIEHVGQSSSETTLPNSTFPSSINIEHVGQSCSEDFNIESTFENNSNEMDIEEIDEVQYTSFVEMMNDAIKGYTIEKLNNDVQITQSNLSESNMIQKDSIDKMKTNVIEEINNDVQITQSNFSESNMIKKDSIDKMKTNVIEEINNDVQVTQSNFSESNMIERDSIDKMETNVIEETNNDVQMTQSNFSESNMIERDSIDKMETNVIEKTNNETPLNSSLEIINDEIEHPTFEKNNTNTKTTRKYEGKLISVPNQFLGVHLKQKNWIATLPRSLCKGGKYCIGQYATAEAAARVRDLAALKLEKHKDENFELNYPISDYSEDLKEMENWDLRDYMWSLNRQSSAFRGAGGFKCLYLLKHKKGPQMWEGRILHMGGKLKGYKNIVRVDKNLKKEIPAIFCDLVNLHLQGWEFMTNFRPGLYSESDVKEFITLLEKKEQSKAYEWDLIKRILAEPLPYNSYIENPTISKRKKSTISSFTIVQKSANPSNIEINKKNQQNSILEMKKNAREKKEPNKFIGVSSVRSKYWKATMIHPNSKNNGRWTIGHYATIEDATRVRDLIALKLNHHKNNKNYHFHFPISDYNDDLEEMKNWSEKDYIWSLRRQSLAFSENESHLRCVRSSNNNVIEKSKYINNLWEGFIINHGGKVKGFEGTIIIGPYDTKQIPAIFCDMINLYIKGWDYVTNYRPGHYSQACVENFVSLLEKHQQDEALEWELIEKILAEPLPSIIHIQRPTSEKNIESNSTHSDTTQANNENINGSSSNPIQENVHEENDNLDLDFDYLKEDNIQYEENCLKISLDNLKHFDNPKQYPNAKMQPRDIAKYFIECPWEQLDTSWALAWKLSDDWDLNFENSLRMKYGASTWSPSHIKSNDFECKQNREYKFYFPCVISTSSSEINIYRCILGLDYFLHKMNLSCSFIEDIQKQWVNVPNIKYLEISFTNIIASYGGLLVVEGGKQPCQFDQMDGSMDNLFASYNHYWMMNDYIKAKNQSMIIVTNPLTREIKLLPPIPQKVLREIIAQLSFYSSERITYRLILIGSCHCEEEVVKRKKKKIESEELGLVVYCSIKNSWVHFDKVLNAAPPSKTLGRQNLIVRKHSIYYGGVQIHRQLGREQILKPVIIYFNTHISRRQKLIIDFAKAGKSYSINVVEPPKLVQIGFNAKIYAVSREAQLRKGADTLFIIEVVVNTDGTPTGSYKVLSKGVMPKSLYSLLFRKTNTNDDEIPIYGKDLYDRDYLLPWEAIGSASDIAIKVIGFDPIIALYNVQDGHWNYSCFPYTEPFEKFSDHEGWRLIPGVYEPRWNAIP